MNLPKFRIWDEEGKKFVKSDTFLSLFTFFRKVDRNNLNILNLQQFTGLKDDNGADIYEGDILDFRPNYKSDDKFKGVVFYDEEDGAFYHTFLEGRPNKRLWGRFTNYTYKVIGHIFDGKKHKVQ